MQGKITDKCSLFTRFANHTCFSDESKQSSRNDGKGSLTSTTQTTWFSNIYIYVIHPPQFFQYDTSNIDVKATDLTNEICSLTYLPLRMTEPGTWVHDSMVHGLKFKSSVWFSGWIMVHGSTFFRSSWGWMKIKCTSWAYDEKERDCWRKEERSINTPHAAADAWV